MRTSPNRPGTAVTATLAVLLAVTATLWVAPVGRGGPAVSEGSPAPVGDGPLATDAVPLSTGVVGQPLAGAYPVALTFTLEPSHPAALSTFLSAVQDPGSPEYHHFLTHAEYVADYAPSPVSLSVVLAAVHAAGATSVTVAADRAAVIATMPASSAEALLGTPFVRYGSSGSMPLYTVPGPLALPPTLRSVLSGIDGLSDSPVHGVLPNLSVVSVHPLSEAPGTPGSGLFVYDNGTRSQWFLGSDFTEAYGASALFPGGAVPNATFPTGVAVATLLASGYNSTTGTNLPPWDPAVLDPYFNQTFPSGWPLPSLTGVPVTIGTSTPPLPGTFGGVNDTSLDETENSLDLEMAGSLAPGAHLYNFYISGSIEVGTSSAALLASYFAQSLSEALAYNYSPAHLGVVSASFGLPDLNSSFWDTELGQAAAEGVTVVVASGDQGNAPDSLTGRTGDGQWPTWPASASFNSSGAIAVGGVNLSLSGRPTTFWNGTSLTLGFDANITGIGSTSAWYDSPAYVAAYNAKVAGTEGGISTIFPEPNWQFRSAAQPAIVNATVAQGFNALHRAEPDVAFPANDTIATVYADASGQIYFALLEGTSIAAPMFAGLLADIVNVESARAPSGWAPLGFLDPTLYRIASFYAENPTVLGSPFLEVDTGHNYVFSASAGWDALTGWGGIDPVAFLASYGNATIRDYAYTGPSPGLPPPSSGSSQTVPWLELSVIVGVGLAVAIVLILVMVRPRRSTGPVRVPYGATTGAIPPVVPGGTYPGSTFLCPFCGGVRPAEPVRCPQCGAY